jgi:hypothetical protein
MLVSVVENGKVEGKVTHTFEFCKNAVANSESCPRMTGGATTNVYIVSDIKVDDTFKAFYEFCGANDIPVVVVSRYRKQTCGFTVLHIHTSAVVWRLSSAQSCTNTSLALTAFK